MKEFNWSEFKDKNNIIAVHCKTEEEAEDFCKKMHERGMKWNGNGDSFLETTKYHTFQKETCYSGTGCYCPYDYYKENEYTILEWSDYMQKEFTKADLKDGMVIETRERGRYLVLGNRAIKNSGYNSLNGYGDDLTECRYHNKSYDIVRVFKARNDCVHKLDNLFHDENLELIWERKETKRMTTEEMRQKLEELTGEKIEVEPSREEMVGKIKEYCCGRACRNCCIVADCENLNYSKLDSEKLKQCYEKVMEDGRN